MWIRIKIAHWINLNESYITLHSGMHLPTITIILPMNGVSSNLAFTRKFYCFIPNVKFLVLVLNDSIQVPTKWDPDLDTSIPSFKRNQQEFNILNRTKELLGECLGTAVWQVWITPSIGR